MNTIAGFCLKPGTVLDGRYQILKVLGIGGFGITYEAVNERINLRVAIKEFYCREMVYRDISVSDEVISSEHGASSNFEKAKQRFLREARIVGDFENEPGIVKVVDYFEENGTAYIVMGYLEGITLKQYLAEHHPFSDKEIARLLLPLMESLQKIHGCGIIHRDISPDNIMILSDGSARLLDFGAAKDYLMKQDKTCSVVLKTGYAPCEQYDPHGNMGPWTDIYALCATMYECVTGQKPVSATSRAIHDELKTFSELGIKVSTEFEKILKKGLQISWKDRYQTVEELVRDIKGWMDKSKEKKHPVRTVLVTCLVCASVLAAAVFGLYYRENPEKFKFRGVRTETVVLVPDVNMSAKEYHEAVEVIQKRVAALAGENDYIVKEESGKLRIVMPLAVFGEDATAQKIETIIKEYVSCPLALSVAVAREDKEKSEFSYTYCDLEREDIVSAERYEGTLPVESNGNFEDTDSFVKFTVSVEKASELREKLLENYNRKDWGLYLAADRTLADSAYKIACNEEMDTFYLPFSKDNSAWKVLLEYPEIAMSFNCFAEIPVVWEEESVIEGENQCREDEIAMPAVCLEYGRNGLQDTFDGGDWVENIANLKDSLDALGIPYAFGTSGGERQKVVVKTAQKDMSAFVSKILAYFWPSCTVTYGNTELGYLIIKDVSAIETDKGTYALQVKVSENSLFAQETDRQLSEVQEEEPQEWGLMINGEMIAKTDKDLSEALKEDEAALVFEKNCLGNNEKFDEGLLPLLKLIETTVNTQGSSGDAFWYRRSWFLSEDNMVEERPETSNSLWEPYDSEYDKICETIVEAYPEAEMELSRIRDGFLEISLHMDIQQDYQTDILRAVKKIYNDCGLQQGIYDGVLFYADDGEEVARIALDDLRYLYEGEVSKGTIFVTVPCMEDVEIFKELLEADEFFKDFEPVYNCHEFLKSVLIQ